MDKSEGHELDFHFPILVQSEMLRGWQISITHGHVV